MSETPEHANEPTGPLDPASPPRPRPPQPVVAADHHRPNRLYQVAAWVAIVAGVLVIAGTVFFAGFVLGRASDGGHGHFRHHPGMMMQDRGGPMAPPMLRPDGVREGHMWPGPGNAPGDPAPGAGPSTTAPGR
ncbi:hypothetical protein [[Mycobacterium] burgundiense]|uniref:Proline rich protein n=1 Tax=[Mycobacterium] burgundiense TaxID=3064286 RepID=A0ABM9L997_9MYCO|nr:hypothetical protein [Mycolicibacterium sp. MU0053]CAJ1495005.1 hypothetical protein MU0053_000238 [Mycolicibacterium sp. MU0053]